ncbi:MAG: hypothetical protein IPL78_29565 [Chloroflexi bacterium]|nr:hypothetical protein [Chloroflexota bacterium]
MNKFLRNMEHRTRSILLLLILLLALLLRVHDLDGASFWSDEGLSLYRAQQPVDVILANTITIDGVDTTDTNPPLYFLLLHGWRTLTGEAVWTLRYLGVLLGVLNVAVMVPVARGLFGRWRLAAGGEQLAVSSEQLAVSSEQLAVSSEQLAVSSDQSSVTSHQSQVSQSLSLSVSHPLIPLAAAFLLASPLSTSGTARNYAITPCSCCVIWWQLTVYGSSCGTLQLPGRSLHPTHYAPRYLFSSGRLPVWPDWRRIISAFLCWRRKGGCYWYGWCGGGGSCRDGCGPRPRSLPFFSRPFFYWG